MALCGLLFYIECFKWVCICERIFRQNLWFKKAGGLYRFHFVNLVVCICKNSIARELFRIGRRFVFVKSIKRTNLVVAP